MRILAGCGIICLGLLVLISTAATACFGPKLFCGVEPGAAGDLRYALVSLYIKEKTGVEMTRSELAGKAPAAEVAAERLDLAFSAGPHPAAVLLLPDASVLLAGKRVHDDLQFTTVLPALAKLQGVLNRADWPAMLQRVNAGEGALAVARSFFKSQGAL